MSKITVRCALTAEQYEAFVLLPGTTEEQKIMQAIATQWQAVEQQAAEQRANMEAACKSPLEGFSKYVDAIQQQAANVVTNAIADSLINGGPAGVVVQADGSTRVATAAEIEQVAGSSGAEPAAVNRLVAGSNPAPPAILGSVAEQANAAVSKTAAVDNGNAGSIPAALANEQETP